MFKLEAKIMNQLINCSCGKGFPFNPFKHRYHPYIYCPHCHMPHKNPSKARWRMPKPNLGWIKEKLEIRKAHKQGKEVLEKYFKVSRINPRTGKYEEFYTFSLHRWMRGERPKLTIMQVQQKLGFPPPNLIVAELNRLDALGVRIGQQQAADLRNRPP